MLEPGRIQAVRAGDKEALRTLLSENIRSVYAHALSLTGEEAAAKAALKETLHAAQQSCADCPEEPFPWLCSLCDAVCGKAPGTVPEDIVCEADGDPHPPVENTEFCGEAAAEPVPEAALKSVQPVPQPAIETAELCEEAPEADVPVSGVRRPDTSRPGYDMAQDEWLANLRAEKHRARLAAEQATEAQPPVEKCESETLPAENSVEEEDFPRKRKFSRRFFAVLALVLFIVVISILLWSIVGLLMNMDVLAWKDLGYTWFNTHIMDMF